MRSICFHVGRKGTLHFRDLSVHLKYRRETRLLTIAFPVPPCDRLDYEAIHITKKRNGIGLQSQLDGLDFADDSSPVSHPATDARKDQYCGGTLSASKAEYP